ncbi:hypothetical protein [Crystallibacter degradans]|uniref:hypothetical protein n=1 Tax=Crystallibacter degradans TaxID=2726743 RepID=UPI0014766D78|nr:hypothetical protein [Arthrobacter sp. SF27]NMR32451.1 hypothetical protein [Arthrobacter sp. SF27]
MESSKRIESMNRVRKLAVDFMATVAGVTGLLALGGKPEYLPTAVMLGLFLIVLWVLVACSARRYAVVSAPRNYFLLAGGYLGNWLVLESVALYLALVVAAAAVGLAETATRVWQSRAARFA